MWGFGRSRVDFDGRRLKSKGLGFCSDVRLCLDEACTSETFFGRGDSGGAACSRWEAWRLGIGGVGRGERAKAGCVGCGLRAELSEVEIRAGTVTDVHGLAKTLLGVVAVEYNAVEEDGDAFQDNLNETAEKRPVLQSADQCIVNLLLEELSSFVVNARPAPDVLVAAIVLGSLKDTSCDSPHHAAENEISNSEQSVVNPNLLGSPVSTSPVVPEDQ